MERTDWTSAIRSALFSAGLLAFTLSMGGCATYSNQAESMRDNLLLGRADLARQVAEEKDTEQEDVLANLNKGMLRRMTDDYAASNRAFEAAKQRIEELYGVSVSDVAGSVTINDAIRDYKGDRYEQVLLHVFMAMNYLQMGQPDSARVEMLQADVKMMEWGEQPEEDPFVRYFAGMVYEALGEEDQALVSYRKARDVYLATRNETGMGVPVILKRDLLRLLATMGLWNEYNQLKSEYGLANFKPTRLGPNFGELIVVLNHGLAPIRTESSIMTFSPEVSSNVRVAFPVYESPPAALNDARVRIEGKMYDLETVENIDRLARNALEDDMPLIMTRALARAVIKYKSQKEAQNQNALAGFLMTVTNLATERADTRSWSTLPQEIRLARITLPIGTHDVAIEIVNNAGRVVDMVRETVTIRPEQRSILSHHWIAPVHAGTVASNNQRAQ